MASLGQSKTGVDRVALSHGGNTRRRRWLVGKLEAAGLTASMDGSATVLGPIAEIRGAIL